MNTSLNLTTSLTHSQAVEGKVSACQVMQSAAGYYIGTLWEEYNAIGTLIWAEPNSRESGYFATAAEAAAELEAY